AAAAADDLDPCSPLMQFAFFHDDQVIRLRMCSGHGELKLVFRVFSRKNRAATSLFFDTCFQTWPAGGCCRRPRESAPPTSPTRQRPQTTVRSEEHTSELQSRVDLVCRLLLEKKKHMMQ